MARTLYLMRHGTTVFNERQKIQGWCDSRLAAFGRAQCERMGDYFAEHGISFDHAYCSTAGRTAQTLELVTRNQMPYERLDGLLEYHFGILEGESCTICANVTEPFGDFLVTFGGESTDQVRERMVSTLTDIMERPDHETVLAVSHGSSGLTFYDVWRERSKFDLAPGELPPRASAIRYSYENGVFTPEELIALDDGPIEHLRERPRTVWLF